MLTAKLTSRELRAMSPAALKRAAGELSRVRTNSKTRAQELRGEIKLFERKYKMTTKRMIDKVCSGELAERGDIETWLIKYNLFKLHAKA